MASDALSPATRARLSQFWREKEGEAEDDGLERNTISSAPVTPALSPPLGASGKSFEVWQRDARQPMVNIVQHRSKLTKIRYDVCIVVEYPFQGCR